MAACICPLIDVGLTLTGATHCPVHPFRLAVISDPIALATPPEGPDDTAALAARVAFLLDRLAEVCDGHETCEGCHEPLCEACEVGEYGSQCNHGRILCAQCDAEGYCRDCALEDHEYDKADRLWGERGSTEL